MNLNYLLLKFGIKYASIQEEVDITSFDDENFDNKIPENIVIIYKNKISLYIKSINYLNRYLDSIKSLRDRQYRFDEKPIDIDKELFLNELSSGNISLRDCIIKESIGSFMSNVEYLSFKDKIDDVILTIKENIKICRDYLKSKPHQKKGKVLEDKHSSTIIKVIKEQLAKINWQTYNELNEEVLSKLLNLNLSLNLQKKLSTMYFTWMDEKLLEAENLRNTYLKKHSPDHVLNMEKMLQIPNIDKKYYEILNEKEIKDYIEYKHYLSSLVSNNATSNERLWYYKKYLQITKDPIFIEYASLRQGAKSCYTNKDFSLIDYGNDTYRVIKIESSTDTRMIIQIHLQTAKKHDLIKFYNVLVDKIII